MSSPAGSRVPLLHHLYLSIVLVTVNAHGFPCSLCVTSITIKMGTKKVKHQAHTMHCIIIGRPPTSNALLVYNMWNKQYYEPDSYHIDSYHLPGLVYAKVKYDGGLFCSLLCDNNPSIEEKYPPGTVSSVLICPRKCSLLGQ